MATSILEKERIWGLEKNENFMRPLWIMSLS